MRADAALLRDHLAAGKSIGTLARLNPMLDRRVKDSLYIADSIVLDGTRCDTVKAITDLIAWLQVHETVNELIRHWAAYPIHGATLSLQIAELRRRLESLTKVMELRNAMVTHCNTFSGVPAQFAPSIHDTRALEGWVALLNAVDAYVEWHSTTDKLRPFVESARAWRTYANAHQAVYVLCAAAENKDWTGYDSAFDDLKEHALLRSRVLRLDELWARWQREVPQLYKSFAVTFREQEWDAKLTRFEEAWNWCRAKLWVQRFIDDGEELLQQALADAQSRERQAIASLASERAWAHLLHRLTEEQRQHLVAWRLAIRKVGKGTGKYASLHRREAREHMEQCREAVPAWIMPIFKVAESIEPKPEMFDTVIVDEASQSGPEALFLHYIAKKIVVVGDDQQISPESVGVDRTVVESLRNRYTFDLPHQDALGVDDSFFNQAEIRFGGRIRLREHFRCMPEIIQFSSSLCYQSEPLVPLRQYGAIRLMPVRTSHVPDGYLSGKTSFVNNPEAEAVVNELYAAVAIPRTMAKHLGSSRCRAPSRRS